MPHNVRLGLNALIVPAQVRRALHALPLGADEGAKIAALEARARHLAARAEALRGKLVLRPEPSQYGVLQRELGRFLGGPGSAPGTLGSMQRITSLLHALQVWGFHGLRVSVPRACRDSRVWGA